MKKPNLFWLAALVPLAFAGCQSSQTAVSSFAGSNLVGDSGRTVVYSDHVDRGGIRRTERRVKNSNVQKPRQDTTSLTMGSFDLSAVLTRKAPKRTRKSRTSRRAFIDPARFQSGGRESSAPFILASLPKNEAATSRRKGASHAAPPREARKSSKRNRSTSRRSRYRNIIAKYARANGVPLRLAMAVVQVESNYRANARGRAGEIGLMQIMPRTARGIGYKGKLKHLYNPETNIRYGMKYLGKAYRLGGRTTCGAILKYNAGHGAKRMNPISRKYCNRVARILRKA